MYCITVVHVNEKTYHYIYLSQPCLYMHYSIDTYDNFTYCIRLSCILVHPYTYFQCNYICMAQLKISNGECIHLKKDEGKTTFIAVINLRSHIDLQIASNCYTPVDSTYASVHSHCPRRWYRSVAHVAGCSNCCPFFTSCAT